MQSKQDDLSEVTLVLEDGKKIRVSRKELLEASSFFFALLNSDMKENREGIVRLEHITETVMRDILEFMRSGNVKITGDNAKDLIEAADYLLIPSLKTTAERFLEQGTSTSNCISSYYFAKRYQCDRLLFISRKFIFSNFAAVAESREFLNLESQQVEEWIASDEIVVSKEDEVFKIILQWIEQNKSERKWKFEELFCHVRLAFMSRDYLHEDVVINNLVQENSSCLKLVEDAMKGIYRPQSPRKWPDSHIVVFTGKETLCCQPDEGKWYHLTVAPPHIDETVKFLSFQGNLFVFPMFMSNVCAASEMYDPLTNSWTRLGPKDLKFPDQSDRKTTKSAVAVVEGDIYSVNVRRGFLNSNCFISKYNVESNLWRKVHSSLCSANLSGYGICAVALDNYLYVLGGYGMGKLMKMPQKTALSFDILKSKWKRKADLQMERCYACGAAARGKIFIAGGYTFQKKLRTSGYYTDTCEVYNPDTDEWQLIASLNTPRSGGNMVCLGGTLYVVGGISDSLSALAVEMYEFEENRWKQKTTLPIDKGYSRGEVVNTCTFKVTQQMLGRPVNKGLLGSFKQAFQRR